MPRFKCTSLVVVWVGVHHLGLFPVNNMRLLSCMLCSCRLGQVPACKCLAQSAIVEHAAQESHVIDMLCVYKSPCHVLFDLPLMKALDWAETSGNFVTIDICPSIYLASEVLNPKYSQLSFYYLFITSAVEVNFNENGYTVVESDGQVSVSLRIDGQFYVPMWAVVEISEGTATGGLCMSLGM